MYKRQEHAAEQLRFEEAARLRDRLQALQKLEQSQKVVDAPSVQRDVICLRFDDKNAAVVVLLSLIHILQPTGANDVYHIKAPDGRLLLAPAIPQVVREVDVASKTMKITPMEGLFDL